MGEFITVAKLSQIPLERGLSVRVNERDIALFNIDGTIAALDGRCPHRGGPLGEGMTENGRVYCPLHGWEFDVKTGACIENPEKPVRCFPVRISGDDVQVQIDTQTSL